MDLQKQFAANVEAFLKASKMPPTTFGKAAAGDPSFVFELREGRSPGLRLAGKVKAYMEANPPREDN